MVSIKLKEKFMKNEYDFLGGVKGKHYKKYRKGHTIIINKDDKKFMPPENQISGELIKSVEASEEDYKKGQFVRCKNENEIDDFYKNILEKE